MRKRHASHCHTNDFTHRPAMTESAHMLPHKRRHASALHHRHGPYGSDLWLSVDPSLQLGTKPTRRLR
eukprot:2896858-Prymnesium_polylepis.1